MDEVVQSDELCVTVDDVELCYETFGSASNPALVVINGLGGQMLESEGVTSRLIAGLGYFVVQFDNRDAGKSTKFEEAGIPSVDALRASVTTGAPIAAPYTLKDMAGDTVGLMEALRIESAHVIGISMGGMIGQMLAIHYPERLRTLTTVMSSPGWQEAYVPSDEVLEYLLATPPTEREAYCEFKVQGAREICGPKYPINEEVVRRVIAEAFDRSYCPEGRLRQYAAILASGNWTESLKSVHVPTLVIHGDADPVVPVDGGKALAEAIPEAKLMIVDGMGHSIPEAEAQNILGAIMQHVK
jgi:pimeloyl-ACP methyl ester carboxylesterase